MIAIREVAAQGDVLFRRIAKLPEQVIEQRRTGRVVVAHSETGHHHAIENRRVRFYESGQGDPMIAYLSVDGDFADVVHHRAHDTHAPLRLPHGLWEVRRQREWMPEGGFESAGD